MVDVVTERGHRQRTLCCAIDPGRAVQYTGLRRHCETDRALSVATSKKAFIYSVLCAICLAASIYVAWDLTRVIAHLPSPQPQSDLMQGLRILVVVLCNILIQLIGRDGEGHRLATLLGIAFVLILVADLVLTFHQVIPAVLTFLVAQLLLAARHLRGFGAAWSSGALRRRLPFLVVVGVVELTLIGATLGGLCLPLLGPTPQFFGIAVYALALGFSVWAAYAALVIGHFPKANAVLVAIGMTCFAACDVTVGVSIAVPPDQPLYALQYLTWTFYTPALVLLVLSGYSLRYLAPWLPD